MAHETDYQRARRQRIEVKRHGITGSTPEQASKRIKEHTSLKSKALKSKMEGESKVSGARARRFYSSLER